MKKTLFTHFFCVVCVLVQANTYYVSSTGNDNSNGKTVSEAWKTLSKVNSFVFAPGDILKLQAGVTFNGFIALDDLNNVTITSYGQGKATIASGIDEGIYIGNSDKVTISNLNVKGAGYMATSMWTNGIDFYMYEDAASACESLVLDNVEVSGYGSFGLYFGTESASHGFKNVSITNSLMHDNGMGGIQIGGFWNESKKLMHFSNENVYIANCKVYKNYGRKDYKSNWSGSGILVSGTVGGTVEYCEAYENGNDNGSTAGGPIGIWMDNSKYVTIQNCISHHNKGGAAKTDGGGFDIDGGCFGSVIQNCQSYENEGCGYGFFQWQTGNPWSNDTVRNCSSTNDARNTKYGAFSFWGASGSYKVTNAQIYGNTVSMDKPGQILKFIGNNYSNISISNNAFCLFEPATFYSTLPATVTLSNNAFPCLVLSIRKGTFNVKRIS